MKKFAPLFRAKITGVFSSSFIIITRRNEFRSFFSSSFITRARMNEFALKDFSIRANRDKPPTIVPRCRIFLLLCLGRYHTIPRAKRKSFLTFSPWYLCFFLSHTTKDTTREREREIEREISYVDEMVRYGIVCRRSAFSVHNTSCQPISSQGSRAPKKSSSANDFFFSWKYKRCISATATSSKRG